MTEGNGPHMPDKLPLAQIEALFGFRFTPIERALLTTTDALLDPYERQHRYVLMMSLQTCQCPACGYLICQRSATDYPDAAREHSTPDDAYTCPNCQIGLTWRLGLIGGGQWFEVTHPQALQNRLALADAEARHPRLGREDDATKEPESERGACICEGRGGHKNPACPWYGTDTDGGAR